MLALQADMPLPKEVDDIRVEVVVRDEVRFANDYTVGAGYLKLPATVAIVADDPSAPVTIRVIGKKNDVVRTLKETITTIPKDRVATLRMPIQWLCDGSAKAAGSSATSTCANGMTCQAGDCVPQDVPATDLPTYTAPDVFGGGDEQGSGTCFDTVPCMTGGTTAVPDGNCAIPAPRDSENVNIALRVPSGGICDDAETNCFVPLDRSDHSGWRAPTNGSGTAGGLIQLPKAVCSRLADGRVRAVVVSTTCPTKTERNPTCGPWSSVTGSSSRPAADAGVTGPALVATVPTALGVNDGAVCCPLMSSDAKLLTCVCRPNSKVMQIVAVSPTSGQVTPIAAPELSGPRNPIPAAAFGGAVYFIDRNSSSADLNRVSIGDGQISKVATATADVYDESSLLIDDTAAYALASKVSTADAGAEVSLIKIEMSSGTTTSFSTGSDKVIYQFVQDTNAVYVGSVVDAPATNGTWNRTTHLLRLEKATGASSVVADATALTNSDNHGGFFGLRLAGGDIYATQEGDLRPDGMYTSSIVKLSIDGKTKTPPLLEELLKVDQTQNKTLGVSGSSLFVFRQDLAAANSATPGAIQASSVFSIPTSGGPSRSVADFLTDAPLGIGPGLVEDSAFVYWINRSGRIFKAARN
jgi:hypothetical protein